MPLVSCLAANALFFLGFSCREVSLLMACAVKILTKPYLCTFLKETVCLVADRAAAVPISFFLSTGRKQNAFDGKTGMMKGD